MRAINIVILAFALFFSGCSKEKISPAKLEGRWKYDKITTNYQSGEDIKSAEIEAEGYMLFDNKVQNPNLIASGMMSFPVSSGPYMKFRETNFAIEQYPEFSQGYNNRDHIFCSLYYDDLSVGAHTQMWMKLLSPTEMNICIYDTYIHLTKE